VLRRLLEDSGQLVTKEELLRAGWANTHVTDGVLKVSILEFRRALGDDSAAPRFIDDSVPRAHLGARGARRARDKPMSMEPGIVSMPGLSAFTISWSGFARPRSA